MKRRRIVRTLGTMAAVAGLVLGTSGQASAVYAEGQVYRALDNSLCVKGYAATNSGSNFTYKSVSRTYGYVACGGAAMPAHTLSVERVLLAYSPPPRDEWWECNRSGPAQNQSITNVVEVRTKYVCDRGLWYATFTGAYAWDGGAWQGGWIGSNNEWFPPLTLGAAASSASAAPKTSAAEAIRRGEVRKGGPDGPKVAAADLLKAPATAGG
jgi:hypothetical protein